MLIRNQQLQGSEVESIFLCGARQTGKSTLWKSLFKDALWKRCAQYFTGISVLESKQQ